MAQTRWQSDGFATAVMVEGSLALVAALLAWLLGVPLREQFPSWGQPLSVAAARGSLAALPMLLLFGFLVHSNRPALRHLRQQVEWLVGEMFPTHRLTQFAFVAILAGVGEELLFRGVIQNELGDWLSPPVGLALAGLLFGAAHALSKLYFVLATGIGLYLGWFAWYFGELVTPIVAHALYDFLALAYLSRIGQRARQQRLTEKRDDNDRQDRHESTER